MMLDYSADHFFPVYGKVISADLCYDSLCCLTGMFRVESTKELLQISDIKKAKAMCVECPYSNLGVD